MVGATRRANGFAALGAGLMLLKLLDYLDRQGAAGSAQIAAAIGAEAGVVEGMLVTLERRGLVCRAEPAGCSGGCAQCGVANTTLYRLAAADGHALSHCSLPTRR